MSASMPFAWIERPDGVKYRAVVNRKAPLSAPIRDDGLHGTFAERARADECGALVILQRAGDVYVTTRFFGFERRTRRSGTHDYNRNKGVPVNGSDISHAVLCVQFGDSLCRARTIR